jgi:hypothetical protein
MTLQGLIGKLYEPGNVKELFQRLNELETINIEQERLYFCLVSKHEHFSKDIT